MSQNESKFAKWIRTFGNPFGYPGKADSLNVPNGRDFTFMSSAVPQPTVRDVRELQREYQRVRDANCTLEAENCALNERITALEERLRAVRDELGLFKHGPNTSATAVKDMTTVLRSL